VRLALRLGQRLLQPVGADRLVVELLADSVNLILQLLLALTERRVPVVNVLVPVPTG